MTGVPSEVRERFAALRAGLPIVMMAPGMSGARVFRVDHQSPLALRRWPQGTSLERVHQVHTLIDSAARHCQWLPKFQLREDGKGTATVDRNGFIWELADWKPGQPLPYAATTQQIQAGARAIARVHESFRQPTESGVPTAVFTAAPSPGIRARLLRIEFLSEQLPRLASQAIAGQVPPEYETPLERTRMRLLANWPRLSLSLTDALMVFRDSELAIQPVLRDIHREHALFTEGQVSGIIDFDAIQWDSPALDLARWASSFSRFSSDSTEILDGTLAAYLDELPFPEGAATPPRKLLRTLAIASSWISLANWAVWLLLERRQFDDFQRVATRIGRLLESTDSLTIVDLHK